MADPRDNRPEAVGDGDVRPLVEDELEELRRLLLAPEQHDLADVRRRLEEIEGRGLTVEEVGRVLPEAVALRTADDDQLARALAPTLEETLRASIQRDPEPVADALYPVIGPAIRKSIREALQSMLEAVNRTVEHSISARSIQWRLEAWRTGRPFSEIVLTHTLQYRVEQVFLIDEETSLPLHHVVAEEVHDAQDEALVSGMLTAIQHFVEDSFGAGENETLDAMQFGDRTVWVEEGPQAILAAVIRGLPTLDVREAMRDVLETIHLQFKRELERFDGDPEPLVGTRPLLQAALLAEYKEKERRRRGSPLLWVLVGLLLVPLFYWGFATTRERMHWQRYLAALDAEPGIVVTQESRAGGRYVVHGLRDPLAADPAALLAATPLAPAQVEGRWEPYQALDSALVLRRAVGLLAPPAGVTLGFAGGTLTASGTAPPAWIAAARQQARFVPGVSAYDDGALGNDARRRLDTLAAALARETLRFAPASARLATGQNAALDALAETVRAALAAAAEAGTSARLELHGHASTLGEAGSNVRISRRRAEAVRRALLARGLPAEALIALGTGTPRTDAPERSEEDRAANRSVSFHLVVDE